MAKAIEQKPLWADAVAKEMADPLPALPETGATLPWSSGWKGRGAPPTSRSDALPCGPAPHGVQRTASANDKGKRRADRSLAVILISYRMPHVFEVAERVHIQCLAWHAAVIKLHEFKMSDKVSRVRAAESTFKTITTVGSVAHIPQRKRATFKPRRSSKSSHHAFLVSHMTNMSHSACSVRRLRS